MDFYLKYTKRSVSSVLLAGVISSAVTSIANVGAINLGSLNKKKKKMSSDNLESANARSKDQAFLDNINGDMSLSTTEDSLTDEEPPDNIDANSSSGDSPRIDSGNVGKQAKSTNMSVGNSDLKNKGKKNPSNEGVSISSAYQKSIVNALRNLNPKYTVPIVLFPALVGGLSGAVKSYASSKKANYDSDYVDPDENIDITKTNENDNSLKNNQNNKNSSNKVYRRIILGIASVVLIVFVFFYRRKLPIIVLGIDRWARIKGWDEANKRYFYRLRFGHKKYKKQFTDDWWKLYVEDKDGDEFISKLKTEDDFYIIIDGLKNKHKDYKNKELHRIVSNNFSLLIKRYIELFGYEKYKSMFPKNWWGQNFGECECGDPYYANLDPYSKEFEEVFFEFIQKRYAGGEKVEKEENEKIDRIFGVLTKNFVSFLSKYKEEVCCSFLAPNLCQWKLDNEGKSLLLKLGEGKYINFNTIIWLVSSGESNITDIVFPRKKFDSFVSEEVFGDKQSVYNKVEIVSGFYNQSIPFSQALGALLGIPHFVIMEDNDIEKVKMNYRCLSKYLSYFSKEGKNVKRISDDCKNFVKKKYVKWCNKYKAVIERYEKEKGEELSKKIGKQEEGD